jgi:hypothetical protein
MPGQASCFSIPLFVTGALMLVAAFLKANPGFGAERHWPWDFVWCGDASLLLRVLYALWVVAGLWALATGFTPGRRLRAVGLLIMGVVLLIGGCSLAGYELGPMLAAILLGGGLLVAGRPASRGRGRLLTIVGALAVVWILAATLSAQGISELESWWQEAESFFADGGDAFEQEHHLWRTLLPQTLLLLAAVGGLLAALGLTNRWFLLGTFVALFASLLMPIGLDVAVDLSAGWDWDVWVSHFGDEYPIYAVLLWLLGVFVTLDLSHTRERAA